MPTWEPLDTHPGYKFDVTIVDPKHYVCHVAWKDGEPLESPQAELDRVHAEHVVINIYLEEVKRRMPQEMKKPLLDSDGDPVFDNDGNQVWVCKDKHLPVITPSPVGEVTEVVIPATKKFPNLIPDQTAMDAEITADMAKNAVIASHQVKVQIDLPMSVVLAEK